SSSRRILLSVVSIRRLSFPSRRRQASPEATIPCRRYPPGRQKQEGKAYPAPGPVAIKESGFAIRLRGFHAAGILPQCRAANLWQHTTTPQSSCPSPLVVGDFLSSCSAW